jgi:tetratricopeptide (TPR) repeat protein
MKFASILCAALLALPPLPAAASQGSPAAPVDQKQLQAQAKQLIAEGKDLEQQGKVDEARDKYVDAEGILSTSDALDAIKRIDDAQKQQVDSVLSEAHRSYDAAKFADAIQQLQKGLKIQPTNASLEYNLAMGNAKLGDRGNATMDLDLAIGALPKGKERTQLLELHTALLTGMPTPDAVSDADKTLAVFNSSYLEEDRDPDDTRLAGGSLCEQTKALLVAFPKNPAVVFNAAKCAEEDTRPGDAAQGLADYLKLAPDALDAADVRIQQASLLSLANLPGDSGQVVRLRFATAARYLDYRRYDRAIGEYEIAEQALPDYPETEWRLGLLYEAFGNVAKAREHFTHFQQLEPDPARKSQADAHVSTLDSRRAVYDANVSEARDTLSDLLMATMGLEHEGSKHFTHLSRRQWRWASEQYKQTTRATEKLSEPYVQRELARAQTDLGSATALFPLGAEANEMLAVIDLQANNWPDAYRSYDAVASQGFPASFYAQEYSGSASDAVRATKVEVYNDRIRIVFLSSYNTKTRLSAPPAKPAGTDDLGNLVISATQPADDQAEVMIIHPADVKGIDTNNNFVELKLANEQIYLSPLDMLYQAPFEGGAARIFGNEFTRLFIRYLGYEDAKLGKEGMTTGEKVKLGFEIARIGIAVGMMGVGSPAAFGSAIRVVQLVHAIAVYRAAITAVRAVNAADAAFRLADDLQESVTKLEQTTSDQRQAVEGMVFKVIPAEPVPLKFEDKI